MGCAAWLTQEAALSGSSEMASLLLHHGARHDDTDSDGRTALFVSTLHGRTEFVAALAEAGANVSDVMPNGATALHISCQRGHLDITAILLQRGADTGKRMYDGATALFLAAQTGLVATVSMLLEQGKSPRLPDPAARGKLIVCGATTLDRFEPDPLRTGRDVGADLSQANKAGATPLLIACEKGHTDVTARLLDSGAQIDETTEDGVTPLLIATQEGHVTVVHLDAAPI